MPKNNKNIPVNSMADHVSRGISIDKISINKSDFTEQQYETAKQSHRDAGHTFHIVEKGTVLIEIDFEKYRVTAPAVVYMHPNQVHRILDFKSIVVCSLAIDSENLNPEYLEFLEDIAPVKPLKLTKDAYKNIFGTFALCLHFSTHKGNRLHYLLLKDGCNTLVGLVTSAFLEQSRTSGKSSRPESIAKSFKQLLAKHFHVIKRPADYAGRLNISAHYLNECVKNATGFSVSQLIKDQIILEAKRLLHHSGKSVKEIAFDLGYEDYAYFSRLFKEATGMSALAFRNKNHDWSNTYHD